MAAKRKKEASAKKAQADKKAQEIEKVAAAQEKEATARQQEAAYRLAQTNGQGAINVDGVMVDAASIRTNQSLLDQADLLGL